MNMTREELELQMSGSSAELYKEPESFDEATKKKSDLMQMKEDLKNLCTRLDDKAAIKEEARDLQVKMEAIRKKIETRRQTSALLR